MRVQCENKIKTYLLPFLKCRETGGKGYYMFSQSFSFDFKKTENRHTLERINYKRLFCKL